MADGKLGRGYARSVAFGCLHSSGADCRRLLPECLGIESNYAECGCGLCYLQPLMAFGLGPLILGERLNSRTLVPGINLCGSCRGDYSQPSRALEHVSEQPEH